MTAWFMNGCIRLFKDHLHLNAVFHHPQNQFQLENCRHVSPLSIFTIRFHQSPYRKKDIYIFNVKNYITNAENNNNLHLKSSTINLEIKQQLYNNCALVFSIDVDSVSKVLPGGVKDSDTVTGCAHQDANETGSAGLTG